MHELRERPVDSIGVIKDIVLLALELTETTLRQGNIPPTGVDPHLIDHAKEIAGGDSGFLEDLSEQRILFVC